MRAGLVGFGPLRAALRAHVAFAELMGQLAHLRGNVLGPVLLAVVAVIAGPAGIDGDVRAIAGVHGRGPLEVISPCLQGVLVLAHVLIAALRAHAFFEEVILDERVVRVERPRILLISAQMAVLIDVDPRAGHLMALRVDRLVLRVGVLVRERTGMDVELMLVAVLALAARAAGAVLRLMRLRFILDVLDDAALVNLRAALFADGGVLDLLEIAVGLLVDVHIVLVHDGRPLLGVVHLGLVRQFVLADILDVRSALRAPAVLVKVVRFLLSHLGFGFVILERGVAGGAHDLLDVLGDDGVVFLIIQNFIPAALEAFVYLLRVRADVAAVRAGVLAVGAYAIAMRFLGVELFLHDLRGDGQQAVQTVGRGGNGDGRFMQLVVLGCIDGRALLHLVLPVQVQALVLRVGRAGRRSPLRNRSAQAQKHQRAHKQGYEPLSRMVPHPCILPFAYFPAHPLCVIDTNWKIGSRLLYDIILSYIYFLF